MRFQERPVAHQGRQIVGTSEADRFVYAFLYVCYVITLNICEPVSQFFFVRKEVLHRIFSSKYSTSKRDKLGDEFY